MPSALRCTVVLGVCTAALTTTISGQAPGRALSVDTIYDPDRRVDFSGNPPANLRWIDDATYLQSRRTGGGVADAIIADLAEAGIGHRLRSVRAVDSFVPLGTATSAVLVGLDEVVSAALSAVGQVSRCHVGAYSPPGRRTPAAQTGRPESVPHRSRSRMARAWHPSRPTLRPFAQQRAPVEPMTSCVEARRMRHILFPSRPVQSI